MTRPTVEMTYTATRGMAGPPVRHFRLRELPVSGSSGRSSDGWVELADIEMERSVAVPPEMVPMLRAWLELAP